MAGKSLARICFIMQRAYPLFNQECRAPFGGAEVNLYYQSTWFAGRGEEVVFLTGDYGQADVESHEGVSVRRIRYLDLVRYRSAFDKIRRLVNLFRGIVKANADLYVMRSAGENLGWLVFLARYLMGRKVVFQIAHDMDLRPDTFRLQDKKSHFLYGYGLRHCDLIVAQSEDQKAQLLMNTGLPSVVVKNSFRLEQVLSGSEKTTILWVARAEEWKRPRLFLELARRLPDLPFVMIMPGTDAFASEIAEEAGLIPNLTRVGYVPFGEIDRYFRNARVFVNTSAKEGFPNTFIQAFLHGTPVLSFQVDPDGILTRSGLGWCCQESLEVAETILRTLSAEEQEAYGAACVDYVRRNHNIEQNGPIYRQYYEDLLKDA